MKTLSSSLLVLLLTVAALLLAAPQQARAQDHGTVDASLSDGLSFHSADDAFQLRFGMAMQARLDAAHTLSDERLTTAAVPLVRPSLRGRLGAPWLNLFVQPELAGSTPKLLDLALDLNFDPRINLRVGQFRTPFSRTFITPITNLLFTERSPADVFFRAGRDTGAMVFGAFADGHLEYNLGAFNGNGINGKNDDRDFEGIARVAFNPLGAIAYDEIPAIRGSQPLRIGIGVGALRGERTDAPAAESPGGKTTWTGAEVDLALHADIFALQAEGYARWTDPSSGEASRALGGYAQAGALVWGPWLEVGARASYVDPSDAASDDDTLTVEGVANVYGLGNHLKLQSRFGVESFQGHQGQVGTLLTQVMF